MTVSTEACGPTTLRWTGAESSFAPGWPAGGVSDVKVSYLPDATSVRVDLVRGTHFAVALAAGSGDVTVTPLAMPPGPGDITILRKTPALQPTNFANLVAFNPATHTQRHDQAAMRDAEMRRDIGASGEALENMQTLQDMVAQVTIRSALALAAALAAEASAAALGNAAHQYDTFAQAIGAVIPAPVQFVRLNGYYAAGDGGENAIYKRRVGADPLHGFQSADGSYFGIVSGIPVTFEMFGAKGDANSVGVGGADDTAAIIKAFLASRTVRAMPGKNYRCTDETPLPDYTSVDFRGARIHYKGEGKYCLTIGNYCVVENGWVKNYGTDGWVSGDRQTPISIGKARPSVVNVHDVIVRNMIVENDWDQATGVAVWSGSYNVLVENIRSVDADMYTIVGAEWSGTNTPGGTHHPHNLVFRNIMSGKHAASNKSASSVVWLSSCYNVLVENVHAEDCGTLLTAYAGDYGSEYASAAEKRLIGKGIVARNISADDCFAGLTVDGVPELLGAGFYIDQGIDISHIYARTTRASSGQSTYGVSLSGANDVSISHGTLSDFAVGVQPAGTVRSTNVTLSRLTVTGCLSSGISASLATYSPIDWLIENCVVVNANSSGATGAFASGIVIGDGSSNIVCRENRIRGTFTRNGIYVSSGATTTCVENNIVTQLAVGGVAYNINAMTRGRNNSADAGITLHSGRPIFDGLTGFATIDLPSIAAGGRNYVDVTVPGAKTTDVVAGLGHSDSSGSVAAVGLTGVITATNNVRVWVHNYNTGSAIDLPLLTYTAYVKPAAG